MITEIITLITISYLATGCGSKQTEKVVIDAYGDKWVNRNGDGKVWINEFNGEECVYYGDGMWANKTNGEKWVNETFGKFGKDIWINGNNGDIWYNDNRGSSMWRKKKTTEDVRNSDDLEFWFDVRGDGKIWSSAYVTGRVTSERKWELRRDDGTLIDQGRREENELPFPYMAWLFNKMYDKSYYYIFETV